MKRFAKIISIVLILATVFSLTSCDKLPFWDKITGKDSTETSSQAVKPDSELIIGVWNTEWDIKALLSGEDKIGADLLKGTEEMTLVAKINFTFTDEGKYVCSVVGMDEYDQNANAFCDVIINNLYAMSFENGLTTDTLEVFRANTLGGKTAAQYMELDSLSIYDSGFYRCDDGRVYMDDEKDDLIDSDDYINIEVSKDSLKFISTSDPDGDEDISVLLPMVFTKVI